MEWIKSSEELPPCDGSYEITNFPDAEGDWANRNVTASAYYDGYGFSYGGVYREPAYWRNCKRLEKRYGKIK